LTVSPCLSECSAKDCLLSDMPNHSIENTHDNEQKGISSPFCLCLGCNTVVISSTTFTFNSYLNSSQFDQSKVLHFFFHLSNPASPPPKS